MHRGFYLEIGAMKIKPKIINNNKMENIDARDGYSLVSVSLTGDNSGTSKKKGKTLKHEDTLQNLMRFHR